MTVHRSSKSRAIVLVALMLTAGAVASPSGQVGLRPADDWIKLLERPERIANLKVDGIIARLDLRPGQVVADIGAGTGAFSLPLAKAVGEGGTVYAQEVDPAFIAYLDRKVKDGQVTNVRTVLGTYPDPQLPSRDVDVAFMHDVVHHIEHRGAYLKTLAGYIKPKGRIAIIEYDGKTGPHRADPTLQVTREELDTWMADAGFVPATAVEGLFEAQDPRWFVIYKRGAAGQHAAATLSGGRR